MAERPVLIYLHGFKSSPQALKAQEVAAYIASRELAVDYRQPALPDLPDQAFTLLKTMMDGLKGRKVALIGSSLGGFYATWLAETYDVKAVLVNPAVRPHELMQKYLGINENPYSGVQFELTPLHMETLQSHYLKDFRQPSRFLLLLQTGDEVLDALEASARFSASPCMIEAGGDHRFQHFERYLPRVFAWLDLE